MRRRYRCLKPDRRVPSRCAHFSRSGQIGQDRPKKRLTYARVLRQQQPGFSLYRGRNFPVSQRGGRLYLFGFFAFGLPHNRRLFPDRRVLSHRRRIKAAVLPKAASFCTAFFHCPKRRAVHGRHLRLCHLVLRLYAAFLLFPLPLFAAGSGSLSLWPFGGLHGLCLSFLLWLSKSDGSRHVVFLFRRRLCVFADRRYAPRQRRFHAADVILACILHRCRDRSYHFFEPLSSAGCLLCLFRLFRHTADASLRFPCGGLCTIVLHNLTIVFFCAPCYN